MSLDSVNIDDITEVHLNSLIESGVPEGFKIEYKSEMYGPKDKDKKECLKDISSFANSYGGHLIVGMEEEDGMGVPKRIVPIEGNPDDAVLSIENRCRDAIEPRISGIQVKAVTIQDKGFVLVVRIPKSWIPPHRVCFKGHNRFYIRNSAGAHEASVEELRGLFTFSSTTHEKISAFRQKRMALISADEGPIPIVHKGQLILHVIPLSAFTSPMSIPTRQLNNHSTLFRTLGRSSGWDTRINFDGIMNYRGGSDCHGYTQIFRSGIVEATRSAIVWEREVGKAFSGISIVQSVLLPLPHYLKGLKTLEVHPPFAIMISIQGINGSYLHDTNDHWGSNPYIFRRPDLLLPEIIIEEYLEYEDLQKAMRPAFDALWNAAGYINSSCFSDDDLWLDSPD